MPLTHEKTMRSPLALSAGIGAAPGEVASIVFNFKVTPFKAVYLDSAFDLLH
jgi:hypothetical protein